MLAKRKSPENSHELETQDFLGMNFCEVYW